MPRDERGGGASNAGRVGRFRLNQQLHRRRGDLPNGVRTVISGVGRWLTSGRRVGEVWRVQAAHGVPPRMSLITRYEHLTAGPVLKDAGYASSDYLTAWINFRF